MTEDEDYVELTCPMCWWTVKFPKKVPTLFLMADKTLRTGYLPIQYVSECLKLKGLPSTMVPTMGVRMEEGNLIMSVFCIDPWWQQDAIFYFN